MGEPMPNGWSGGRMYARPVSKDAEETALVEPPAVIAQRIIDDVNAGPGPTLPNNVESELKARIEVALLEERAGTTVPSLVEPAQAGMMVREFFAVTILMGLISKDEGGISSAKDWTQHAAEAYRVADALLKEFWAREHP